LSAAHKGCSDDHANKATNTRKNENRDTVTHFSFCESDNTAYERSQRENKWEKEQGDERANVTADYFAA
jgi:hypothetical protein